MFPEECLCVWSFSEEHDVLFFRRNLPHPLEFVMGFCVAFFFCGSSFNEGLLKIHFKLQALGVTVLGRSKHVTLNGNYE